MNIDKNDLTLFGFGVKEDTPAMDLDVEADRLRGFLSNYARDSLIKGTTGLLNYVVRSGGAFPQICLLEDKISDDGKENVLLAKDILKDDDVDSDQDLLIEEDEMLFGTCDYATRAELIATIKPIETSYLKNFLGDEIADKLTYAHLIVSPTAIASMYLQDAITSHRCSELNTSKWVDNPKKLESLIRTLELS
jgi:hypothetical protein